MGKTCRGICVLHRGPSMPNGLRYKLGDKRCSFCGIYIYTKNIRCPHCKAVLRTKTRNKTKESPSSTEKMKIIPGGFKHFG